MTLPYESASSVQAIAKKQRESQNLIAMEWSTKHSAIVDVSLIFSIVGASNSFITEPATILWNVEQCLCENFIHSHGQGFFCL